MISWLNNDDNKKATQESTKIYENMSEINDIVELPENIFYHK